MSSPTSAPTLGGKKKLGVLAIAFLVIAASAPLTVLAGGVTTALAVTGSTGIPFGYIVLAIALLVFAVGYAAMSRFVTNAGAFYAYIAQGLARPLGVGSSLIALIAYNMMQVGIYGLFGFFVSNTIAVKFGVTTPWYLWVLICLIVVGALGANRIDLSAKVLGVLVGLEFLVVIIFDIAAFIVAPEGVSAAPLTFDAFWGPATGSVLAFGIAAFMGFESGALYGEESKNPKTTVARATYLAVAVIGVFYAISSWALIVGVGPSSVTEAAVAGPDLLFGFLSEHVGVIVSDIASLLFITSLFAALVSFHNAVARYSFSLGREHVLPKGLSRVSKSGAPLAGSLFQSIIAIVVIVGFIIGEATTGGAFLVPDVFGPGLSLNLFPLFTLFTWLTNAGAMGLVLLMVLVSIAVIGYFGRDARGVNVWARIVAPIVAVLALGTVFFLILSNFTLLLTVDAAAPVTWADPLAWVLPAILLVPGIAGVIYGAVIKKSNPKVYEQIGHGIAEDHAAGGLGEGPRGI